MVDLNEYPKEMDIYLSASSWATFTLEGGINLETTSA